MDTERILPFSNRFINFDKNGIAVTTFGENGLKIVFSYLEITRHIQEIQQLFNVFKYNLQVLLATFELNSQDTLIRIAPPVGGHSVQTEINALIVNYISSGKTLIDSLDTCAKNFLMDEEQYNIHKTYVSQIYDSSFSYRFLTRLRDFSQHGHLPVSVDGDRACFDIAQIIQTPHFNHNKGIRGEMEKFFDELLVKRKEEPRLCFSLTVAEYTTAVAEIYNEF